MNCKLIINIQSNIIENYFTYNDLYCLNLTFIFTDVLIFNNVKYGYNNHTYKFEQYDL